MARKKKQLKHKKLPVILIAAIQEDRAIGYQGELLYKIKDDMRHFVEQTSGHTVIMGRKTWESIPKQYRPFSNRSNIVVSRKTNYLAKGALVVNKFFEAIEQAPEDKKIYIIGGGEIYKQALSYADTLDLTIIKGSKQADTFFPEFKPYFSEEGRSKEFIDEETGARYEFVSFVKK